MRSRVLVLGAGFGGLELATILSEAFGDDAGVTVIDQNDAFVFGYSKLDVMFGRADLAEVRLSYADLVKPGVRILRETITAIDPEARRVTTDAGVHNAGVLVVALGADYDFHATPGLAEGGNEFYSVAGAERLRDVFPTFTSGHAVVGVCGATFKCPPAPSEAALLLYDYLSGRGVRDDCEISLVIPSERRSFRQPTPRLRCSRRSPSAASSSSPDTGGARSTRHERRGARRRRGVAVRPLPRRPQAPGPSVVLESGMAKDG